jgi:hypothetical protein
MIKRIGLALLAILGLVGAAYAQTSPNLSPGQVPTNGQWNSYFAAKQDYLGTPALPSGGGIMTGELTTAVPTTASAMFTMPPGVAPTSPVNGDMWMTTAGLFIRVNGSTIGPLGVSACSGCAVLSTQNVFTVLQTVNLNVTALPAPLAGAVWLLSAADSVASREQIDAFGAVPTFSAVTYNGTNAFKTAVTSGTEVGAFNAWAYAGAGLTTTAIAAFHMYAAENISAGHQGSKACIGTTPVASATIADSLCQQGSGGITIGNPTGGDQGAGTINAAGTIFVNGVGLSVGAGTVNAGTANQLAYYAATSNAVSGNANATIASGALTLGVAGSVVGSLAFHNATSGMITISPPTGGLGTVTLTVPAVTDTLATLGQAQTFSGAINFSSTFSIGGNAMTFPGSPATLAALNLTDQTVSGGANVVSFSNGSIAGGNSLTVDCGKSPLQFLTVTGGSAVTINAPVNDGSCMLSVTSSFAPVFSGFTVGPNTGDLWNTAVVMVVSIWRINGVSSYVLKAL